MVVNAQTVITLAALIGAVGAIIKVYNSCYDLVKHQKEQDSKIETLKNNDQALMRAMLGVLDGLIEQGCNGAVHSARDELQKHLVERSTN